MALGGVFGNPPDCVNGRTGRFANATNVIWLNGTVEVDSQPENAPGAGWVVQGLERLHEDEAGHILVANGERQDEYYFPRNNLLPTAPVLTETEPIVAWVDSGANTLQFMTETQLREFELNLIGVGTLPYGIALSPDGNYAYVTNTGSSNVSVIDLVTGQVVATIGVGSYPRGIALSPDGIYAYVTSSGSNSVSVIDLETRQMVATIGVGSGPEGIALSPDGDYAYVINYGGSSVSVVDLVTSQVVATIDVGSGPVGIALSPDGDYAYVTNTGSSNNVSVIDLVTRQVVATIGVGLDLRPESIALSPDGDYAYVATSFTDDYGAVLGYVSVIDLVTRQVVATIYVDSSPRGIAVSADGAYAYVTSYFINNVSVIDLVTRQVVAPIVVGSGPVGIALSPDGNYAYVTNSISNNVSVVDLAAEQATTMTVGNRPEGIALSPDGVYAYVTNTGSSNVSMIDLIIGEVVATIGVGSYPRGIAMSPDGVYAYVTNYFSNNVSVIDLVTRQVVATIGVGSGPVGIALSPDGVYAYVTNTGSSNVSMIDLIIGEVVATIGVDSGPEGIALSADGVYAYVTNYYSNNVSVIDLVTRQVVATIGVGSYPRGIALSADGVYAYVTNTGSSNVSVIDLVTRQVVATIGVGSYPWGIALSPEGAYAYVTNTGSSNVSVIDLVTRQRIKDVPTPSGPAGITVSGVRQLPTYRTYGRTATNYANLTYYQEVSVYRRLNPDGTQIHFTQEGRHAVTVMPDGRQTVYTYNSDGTVATMGIVAPGEALPRWVWAFGYVNGKLNTITDPADRVTQFTVDHRGDLVSVTMPDGASEQFTYDSRHLMTHYTDQNGAVTTHEYDSFGRIRRVTEPPRAVYDPTLGQTTVIQQVRTFTPSDTGYDLVNERTEVGSPVNPIAPVPISTELVNRVEYGRGERYGLTNKWGSWLDETDGEGRTTTYERDARNNLTRVEYGDGDCVEYTYDEMGNRLSERRMEGEVCQNGGPAALEMGYTYEERFNQIKTDTDAAGHTTTYVYDYEEGVGEAGNLIRIEYPQVDDGTGNIVTPMVHYTYNEWGLLETERDARNMVTRYVYTQGTSDEAYGGANARFLPGVTPVPGLLTQVIEDEGGANLVTLYRDFDGAGNSGRRIGPDGRETTILTYDPMNRLLTETDALGIVTQYVYDGRGNLIRQVVDYTPDGSTGRNVVSDFTYNAHDQLESERTTDGPLAVSTQYTYDINRQLAVQQDGRGSTTIHLYDEADQLVNSVDPAGRVMTYTYALDGRLERLMDADGYVTHYEYDGYGRLITETVDEGGLNLRTVYTYDLNDNITRLTHPDQTVTCYEYDSHNRRTAQVRDCGGLNLRSEYHYDVNDNLVYETDPRGVVTAYEYDNLNRLRLIRQDDGGLNLETEYVYDTAGNLAQIIDERGVITGFSYDDLNRLEQTCQDVSGLNLCTSYNYDRLNNQETVTDPEGVTTRTVYNAFGLPTQVIEDDGGLNATTHYSYDNALNLAQIVDANGNLTRYTYTPRNEVAQEIYADGEVVGFTYDGRGNVLVRTTQDNETITHVYDGAGRLLSKDFSTEDPGVPDQTFDYDAMNRLISAAESANGHDSLLTFVYNNVGDVTGTTQALDGLSWPVGYGYDYVSGVYTTTYPSGVQRVQVLDSIGRLDAVQEGDGTAIADYAYHDIDSNFTLTYANGVVNTTEYDALYRTIRVSAIVTDTLISDYRYGYDDAGNRTYMQRWHEADHPADVYAYDNLYQLIQVWYGADATMPISITNYAKLQWYELDNLGNRLEVQNDGVSQLYAPTDGLKLTNPMNRYEAVDTAPFLYDERGNTLADGINTYTYDILNRQIGMSNAENTAEYVYDALGRRIAKVVDSVTTHFVYDKGYQVIEEYAADSLSTRYTYANDIDKLLTMEHDANIYYYHRDALGSTTELTEISSVLAERYEYSVYGKFNIFDSDGAPLPTSGVNNGYFFTGRQYDPESSNYYYRARIYNPIIGRFLQADPIGYEDGRNLYFFVHNNPVNWIDPDGQKCIRLDPPYNFRCDNHLQALGLAVVHIILFFKIFPNDIPFQLTHETHGQLPHYHIESQKDPAFGHAQRPLTTNHFYYYEEEEEEEVPEADRCDSKLDSKELNLPQPKERIPIPDPPIPTILPIPGSRWFMP